MTYQINSMDSWVKGTLYQSKDGSTQFGSPIWRGKSIINLIFDLLTDHQKYDPFVPQALTYNDANGTYDRSCIIILLCTSGSRQDLNALLDSRRGAQ
jgi:hypothetical protein